ncbi:MAG: diphosphomevalonate decarboxylase [Flavobacteriaceae bacterium]|nr:diphosphomevalonate decarboxylase [Flavobacteriaceae bacterium]|tara:strand:- start:30572 stop:31651 length:1080 start_codon:yes stop_codon:yes gene_type:complete
MVFEFDVQTISKEVAEASFSWKSPSNIALVKYWGKSHPQIPKNASISFTLKNSHTITKIDFKKKAESDKVSFDFIFEGKKKDDFKPKIESFFERIDAFCPYLKQYHLTISSENSFPHSSGIASSASGMSAMALCIMSLEKALNPSLTEADFNKKASFLARLGSGSASRSIEGPLVIWGAHAEIEGSSDLFGIPFAGKIHDNFKNYCDTILLVDKGQKQVSSTVGHQLMHNHPFASQRFEQANENLLKLTTILENGDQKAFINLVESEALTLHAMMLTSNPYFILMKPNTLEIINALWAFRERTQSNICFTLDAGANVHVLYPKSEEKMVLQFIEDELSRFCEKNHYICDEVSSGAEQLL